MLPMPCRRVTLSYVSLPTVRPKVDFLINGRHPSVFPSPLPSATRSTSTLTVEPGSRRIFMRPYSTKSSNRILDVTMKPGSMTPAFRSQWPEFDVLVRCERLSLAFRDGGDDFVKVPLDIDCRPGVFLLTQREGVGHDRRRPAPDRHIDDCASHTE
jgi:hypothetical protein